MPAYDRDLARELRGIRGQLSLITVTFFLMLGFQTVELIRDRATLTSARATQEPTVQQSLKVRQQLDAVAGGIARLADAGDDNAQAIVEDFRRQGITVRNPQAGVQQ